MSDKTFTYRAGSDGRIAFKAPGNTLSLDVQAGGDRLPTERLRLGASLKSADQVPLTINRNYWWILNLIVIQFLLVALPEEVFYRGYLQTRLEQLFPKQTKRGKSLRRHQRKRWRRTNNNIARIQCKKTYTYMYVYMCV